MVRIRLTRIGAKKRPFYRIVVIDQRSPRDGKFIEIVGTFNPLIEANSVNLKEERVKYWLEKGADPSDTVRGILKKAALIQ